MRDQLAGKPNLVVANHSGEEVPVGGRRRLLHRRRHLGVIFIVGVIYNGAQLKPSSSPSSAATLCPHSTRAASSPELLGTYGLAELVMKVAEYQEVASQEFLLTSTVQQNTHLI